MLKIEVEGLAFWA